MDIGQFILSYHDDVMYSLRNGEGTPNGLPMRIYHNNRDGTFTQVNRELGVNGCWGTMSGGFGDFNNDGNLDIVLGNGSPKLDRLDPLVLLENDGAKFRNTTFAAGLFAPSPARVTARIWATSLAMAASQWSSQREVPIPAIC